MAPADFTDRAPRLPFELPISLAIDGEEFRGHCKDISRSGMLVSLTPPLPIWWFWLIGEMTAYTPEGHYRIKVRIMRVEGAEVGVAFQLSNENDRAILRALLVLAEQHQANSS